MDFYSCMIAAKCREHLNRKGKVGNHLLDLFAGIFNHRHFSLRCLNFVFSILPELSTVEIFLLLDKIGIVEYIKQKEAYGRRFDMMPDYEKIVQMINFFARKGNVNNRISKLICLKIIYLADRYHLRMYGRTITGDHYVAMQYGPVASDSKRTFEFLGIPARMLEYASSYLTPEHDNKVVSVREPDMNVFSETDIEAMNAAWETYCKRKKAIVAFTHCFPEWKKHEEELQNVKVQNMDFADFFLAAPKEKEYCPAEGERLELNKRHYEEMSQVF